MILATTAQVPVPDARQYRNIDYQFSASIPRRYHGCMTAAPNPNHGFWIPLDRGWPCADWRHRVRYIAVHAAANTAVEAATATELASVECRWQKPLRIIWLRGSISGRRAAGCRRAFADGHVEVSLLVLRKTEPWHARWEEVGVDLVTTPQHYRTDLRVFRRVLRGIRVQPDAPRR